ncbi:MAG: hypothetical protein ACREID_05645 [Planctomycetota bacterium]
MRALWVVCLLSAALSATEDSLASRFPAGAGAYLESRGLAGRLDALLDSGLGKSLLAHPALADFLKSEQGRQLQLGRFFVQGAMGMDLRQLLRAVAGGELAVAVYPGADAQQPRFLAMARVDPASAERLIAGAALLARAQRSEIVPAAEGRPALQRLGERVYFFLDGDLLAVTPHRELAETALAPPAASLRGEERVAEGRRLVGGDPAAYLWVDLAPFAAKSRARGKPRTSARR